MKVVFLGTDEYAASHLRCLMEKGIDVVLAVSQPDRLKGRGRKLLPTPVKEIALKCGLEVIQPQKLTKEIAKRLSNFDIGIVVSYGKIIPESVFTAPRYGMFNVHPSLLPRWRGAAPIQRALEAGDAETGVTIFRVEKELDSGPIALQEKLKIGEYETYGELEKRLINLGCDMLIEFLRLVEDERIDLRPQKGRPIYARKINKDDTMVDFSADAIEVKNKIRAYDPKPGAWALLREERVKLSGVKGVYLDVYEPFGKILKISREGGVISCGSGAVLVEKIQFPGKKPVSFQDALNGRLLSEGMSFKNRSL